MNSPNVGTVREKAQQRYPVRAHRSRMPRTIMYKGATYRLAYDAGDASTLLKGVMKGLGSIGGKLKNPDDDLLSYLDEYIGDLEEIRNMAGQDLFGKGLG